ncbi:hypothetical protein VNI00_007608 [Paramarasmius palmivorus]|uniref:Uncharacterized protein n=1 Tax=Paramarasmius palmivorus TaxID=297713 RepID=A0AAW0D219_9AGAR
MGTVEGDVYNGAFSEPNVQTGILDSLSRNGVVFPQLERLELRQVGLRNAALAFASTSPSLLNLQLQFGCSFETFTQYWELICSFPLLEELEVGQSVDIPFGDESLPAVNTHPPLRLRVLKWSMTNAPARGTQGGMVAAFNALLSGSGGSLEKLINMTRSGSQSLTELSLNGLVRSNPRPEPAFIQDETENWYNIPLNLEAMDIIFRHSFFSSLQRLVFGTCDCIFTDLEVAHQIAAGETSFSFPDDDSVAGRQLNEAIDMLEASFAESGKGGAVSLLVNAKYHDTQTCAEHWSCRVRQQT